MRHTRARVAQATLATFLSLGMMGLLCTPARGATRVRRRGAATAPTVPGEVAVTPAMRAKIQAAADRSEAAMSTMASTGSTGSASTARLADAQVQCVVLEQQRYCLGFGWTHHTREGLVAEAASAWQQPTPSEQTGDLGLAGLLRDRAKMSAADLRNSETEEFTEEAAGLAKVVQIRHQIEGQPIPAGFYERHPEARPSSAVPEAGTVEPASIPGTYHILDTSRILSQHRKNWCGPTAMQSIAWNWWAPRGGHKVGQPTWANRLGTTSAGTAISRMVGAVNYRTGYDNGAHAGHYIVLDISDYTYSQWYLLNKWHYYEFRAPIVLHPLLWIKWYPYLDANEGGHFQVGRGYHNVPDNYNQVSYFEPWNPQYFDPHRKYIKRVHQNNAHKQYEANEHHPMHNLGE